MNKKEILKKAYKKAIANNWSFISARNSTELFVYKTKMDQWFYTAYHACEKGASRNFTDIFNTDSTRLILSHGFAKAFWPQGDIIRRTSTNYDRVKGKSVNMDSQEILDWQYHLQQMVLEEDPIKYLEKFL